MAQRYLDGVVANSDGRRSLGPYLKAVAAPAAEYHPGNALELRRCHVGSNWPRGDKTDWACYIPNAVECNSAAPVLVGFDAHRRIRHMAMVVQVCDRYSVAEGHCSSRCVTVRRAAAAAFDAMVAVHCRSPDVAA